MEIKTKNKSLYNEKVNLPEVGIVDVNSEGIVDVDPKIAEFIVSNSENWSIVSVINNTEQKNESMNINEIKKELLKKSMEELKKIASDSGLEEIEYKNLKKIDLINLLIKMI